MERSAGKRRRFPVWPLAVLAIFVLLRAPLQAQTEIIVQESAVESSTEDQGFVKRLIFILAPTELNSLEYPGFPDHSLQLDLRKLPFNIAGNKKTADTIFKASLVIGTGLNLTDYVLTTNALRYDGVKEANPLLKTIAANPYVFAAIKLGISAVNVYWLSHVYKNNKMLAWALTTLEIIALSYVVYNNIDTLSKARRSAAGLGPLGK